MEGGEDVILTDVFRECGQLCRGEGERVVVKFVAWSVVVARGMGAFYAVSNRYVIVL